MKIRHASVDDAAGMAAVQNEIFAAGLRKAPTDVATVLENYIEHADRIECVVAEDEDGRILGFSRCVTRGLTIPTAWRKAGALSVLM